MTIEAQLTAIQNSVTELILAINVKKAALDASVLQAETARDTTIVARDAAIAAVEGVDPVSVDPSLTALKNLPFTDNSFIVGNGTTWVLESGNVARTSLGLGTTNTPSFVDVLLDGLSVQTRLDDLQTAVLELDTDKVARTALSGIGTDTSQTITNLNTHQIGGTFFAASSATGLPEPESSIIVHMPSVDANTSAQEVFLLSSGRRFWRKVNSDGNWTAWVEVNTPHLSARNRIINGQFRINQRGYVSGAATTGANQYTFDRWRVVTAGQNITVNSGEDSGRIVTAPSGGFEQVIDGTNLEGGTYVLNWTGTATATVNGVSRAKGETFTLSANTNATLRLSSGTVGDVQLELGSTPTAFERLSYGQELANCQRYFEFGEISQIYTTMAGRYLYVPFKTVKRTDPTIVRTGNGSITLGTAGTTAALGTPLGFYWFQASNTNAIGGSWTADAEI